MTTKGIVLGTGFIIIFHKLGRTSMHMLSHAQTSHQEVELAGRSFIEPHAITTK